MSPKIYIVYCTSGLGNRLRPLSSAIAYCQLTGRHLKVYWDNLTPNGCLTPLNMLFANEFSEISLEELYEVCRDASTLSLFTEKGLGHNAQREADLFGRDQLLRLTKYSPAKQSQALTLEESAEVVVVYDNDFLHSIPREVSVSALRTLKPVSVVLERVLSEAKELGLWDQLTQSWRPMKGVHARGTDFGVEHAIDLYRAMIHERLGVNKFFLSTEDKDLEGGIRECFPNQVISRSDRLHLSLNTGKKSWQDPDSYTISVEHGVDALIDIYLLSCVDLEVFHPGSTFSEVARNLRGVLEGYPGSTEGKGAKLRVGANFVLEDINRTFVDRCAQLLPRGSDVFPLTALQAHPGPDYLENLPPEFIYWETLGYSIPMLERMIMVSSSSPNLVWDANRFSQLLSAGLEKISGAEFQSICPYPEALPQLARLQGHIRGSRVLIVGSETYWLELLCCIYGAAEVTTVEYRNITWVGDLVSPVAVRAVTWDEYLRDFDNFVEAYDLVLSYSSIEHSGLGRYGDRFMALGDLYAFLLMSRCVASHGMCAIAVPVGKDLIHFNAHRIYGKIRIRALEKVSAMRFVGMATPDHEYLDRHENEPFLQNGWSVDSLANLPLGKLRQPVLCFGGSQFSNERFLANRIGRSSEGYGNQPLIQGATKRSRDVLTSPRQLPDPHKIALQASINALGGEKFIEVTHARPFGFTEVGSQRVNVTVEEILGAKACDIPGAKHCLLHILLGCGITQSKFIRVLLWALRNFERVHVLEHNSSSSDWEISDAIREEHCISNCLNYEQLCGVASCLSLSVTPVLRLPGFTSSTRNVLITLAGKSQMIEWCDHQKFYDQLKIIKSSGGRHSFEAWNDVYLGTAESFRLVQRQIEKLKASKGQYLGKSLYASCGGFFSLDQMRACIDQGFSELVLFDVNAFTVSFAKTVHELIKNSPSRRVFLENYLLSRVLVSSEGDFEIDTKTTFEERICFAAKVAPYYCEDNINILRCLLFASLENTGLKVWGMRNVGDNRIDIPARLDIRAEQECFTDSNCLSNGDQSWLSSEEKYVEVRSFLQDIPIRYLVAGIDQINGLRGDLVLASNIFDFLPVSFREKIVADIL